MTKQTELEIFDKTIEQLGQDSYLGPWLSEIRGNLEQCIRNDIFPEISLKEAHEQASLILKTADNKAFNIVYEAEGKADKIVNKAENCLVDIRNRIIDALHGLGDL